jgi:hypothetical protein
MCLSATFTALGSAATSTLRLIRRCANGQLLNVRHGSFATGASKSQVRQRPLYSESGSKIRISVSDAMAL